MTHYIKLASVYMMETPSPNAPIASQAYYSEIIKPIEKIKDWVRVQTITDGYEGWVEEGAIYPINQLLDSFVTINRLSAHVYSSKSTAYRPLLTLPFEAKLTLLQELDERWLKVLLIDQREGYIQRGDIMAKKEPLDCEAICHLSKQFLGLPYTWGGRTSFGYDCSGFVQMLYRQMGIHLPRDSKDQALFAGFKQISFKELQPSDLIFFGKEQISHVGMHLKNNEFIHATVAENAPFIRISSLENEEWKPLNWPVCLAMSLREKFLRP